ncbi:hypothetical protein [Providencia rettgeri]|uniref:hypothetical protein n=1 Tax=Providencia rettgeri TaxID=587 RepID=UPI0034E0812E
MQKKIYALLLLVISFSVNSDALYATSAEKLYYPNMQRYGISWISVASANDDVLVTCPQGRFCYYGIFVGALGGGYEGRRSYTCISCKYMTIEKPMTWKEIYTEYLKSRPASGSNDDVRIHARAEITGICTGLVTKFNSLSASDIMTMQEVGCTKMPPTNNSCQIVGDIDIDHHVVSSRSVNGNIAEKMIQLSCSNPATVRFTIARPNLDLGGGVSSQLSIEGYGNTGLINTTASSINLKFQSRLSATSEITSGLHTNSTVLVFNIE